MIGAVWREFETAYFVMVVGSSERARRLGQALEQSSAYGIRLMGFLDEEPGQVQLQRSYDQFPLSALPELLRRRYPTHFTSGPVGLLIRLTSPDPAIFRQERCGPTIGRQGCRCEAVWTRPMR